MEVAQDRIQWRTTTDVRAPLKTGNVSAKEVSTTLSTNVLATGIIAWSVTSMTLNQTMQDTLQRSFSYLTVTGTKKIYMTQC